MGIFKLNSGRRISSIVKIRSLCMFAVLILCLTALNGCNSAEKKKLREKYKDVTVDYGESSIYSEEDIDMAVPVIGEKVTGFPGKGKCELISVSFRDDNYSQSRLDDCNEIEPESNYTRSLVLYAHFKAPEEGGGPWIAGREYEWPFCLARVDDGDWNLVCYGFGKRGIDISLPEKTDENAGRYFTAFLSANTSLMGTLFGEPYNECDVNKDGFPDLCGSITEGSGLITTFTAVYDFHNEQGYILDGRPDHNYYIDWDLSDEEKLVVIKQEVGKNKKVSGTVAIEDGEPVFVEDE